jgi:hypothetical protein
MATDSTWWVIGKAPTVLSASAIPCRYCAHRSNIVADLRVCGLRALIASVSICDHPRVKARPKRALDEFGADGHTRPQTHAPPGLRG